MLDVNYIFNYYVDQDVRRVMALEELAAMGTEDERLLHGLISRHETVMKELGVLHGKLVGLRNK